MGDTCRFQRNIKRTFFCVADVFIGEFRTIVCLNGLNLKWKRFLKHFEEFYGVFLDKRAEARLKALELRAKGGSSKDVAEATGFCSAYVSQLVAKYRSNGLEAISGNHYGGNHRNMSVEEEAAILAPFKARAEKGELVEIREIARAYQSAVDHPVGNGQIYLVLRCHGWRKVMPRSRHPKKASEEEIAASKN